MDRRGLASRCRGAVRHPRDPPPRGDCLDGRRAAAPRRPVTGVRARPAAEPPAGRGALLPGPAGECDVPSHGGRFGPDRPVPGWRAGRLRRRLEAVGPVAAHGRGGGSPGRGGREIPFLVARQQVDRFFFGRKAEDRGRVGRTDPDDLRRSQCPRRDVELDRGHRLRPGHPDWARAGSRIGRIAGGSDKRRREKAGPSFYRTESTSSISPPITPIRGPRIRGSMSRPWTEGNRSG